MTTEEHNLVRLQRSTTWCDYTRAQLGVTTEEHNLVGLQRSTTWCDYRGAQLGVTTEEHNLVYCFVSIHSLGPDVVWLQTINKHKKQTKHRE